MASGHAVKIFFGGDILTMDKQNTIAEALAVKDGTIKAVGKLKDILQTFKGEKTVKINLNNQTLMPGLIEPHQHGVFMALVRYLFISIEGNECKTFQEIYRKIMKEISSITPSTQPQQWCRCFGWDPELVSNLPPLTADYLDEKFSRDVPIFILGQSGHVAWANHKALELAGINDDSEDPEGGRYVRDEGGHLTGQLVEAPAILKVFGASPPLPSEDIKQAVIKQWNDYASSGFTTITDLAYLQSERMNKVLNEVSNEETCPVRMAVYLPAEMQPSGNQKTKPKSICCALPCYLVDSPCKTKLQENEKLWVQGYKIGADGSPHCGTMATKEPYLLYSLQGQSLAEQLGFPQDSEIGNVNYSEEVIKDTIKYYQDNGKQVAIHAHGDRAIGIVINAFKQVLKKDSSNKLRHRMEHLGLITEDQIIEAKQVNLTFSFFVSHLYFYAKSYRDSILGSERANRWTPLSLATKHGICWSLHQDHPTFPGTPRPFESIRTAVTRTHKDDDETTYGEEYCVGIEEALKAYTINAAWQLNRESEIGSLEVGKKADFVILSDNPYNVKPPSKLLEIEIRETYIDGRCNNISQYKK